MGADSKLRHWRPFWFLRSSTGEHCITHLKSEGRLTVPFGRLSRLVVLALLLSLVIKTLRVSYVRLASAHLTDPFATVQALYFPDPDPVSSWQENALRKFEVEGEKDRLYVGVLSVESAKSQNMEQAFGVRKGWVGD
jgi:hypothetical protein